MEIPRLICPAQHPLVLREDKKFEINQAICCGICRLSEITIPFYACDSCEYYIHKTCSNLPNSLEHSFHPKHDLTLNPTKNHYCCSSCHKLFLDAPSYSCDQCEFDMDVVCAMMPPITHLEVDKKNIIQHFSHQHPMQLIEKHGKENVSCYGCASEVGDDPAYGCTRCRCFLHQSCSELLKERRYFRHQESNILIPFIPYPDIWAVNCHICWRSEYSNAFRYECHSCGNIVFCMNCCKLRGTIKYEGHEHLLCFLEKEYTGLFKSKCDSYDSYCNQPVVSNSDELRRTSLQFLQCLDCNFKVHLLCGPLPSSIKHKCHKDPLFLVDSLIEDDAQEYYCDVCEGKRDPRIRVYWCKPCKYIAHVHCVISTEDDLRDVELKTLRQDIWKFSQKRDINAKIVEVDLGQSFLTVKDLITELTDEEKKKLSIYYKWDWDDASSEINLEEEDTNMLLEFPHFTIKDFENFLSELNSFYHQTKLKLKYSDLALKIVDVNGYKIPHSLAAILKALLHKYGDVSSKCQEGIKLKSFIYFILCQVLGGMNNTKVVDITKNHLQEWYFHLRFVKKEGFKIDFASAHITRLVRAFLGVQRNRLENEEISEKINQKIINLREKIEKLQLEIEEENSKLEKCKEYGGSSKASKLMEDFLRESLKLKWQDASEGLFTYQEGNSSENWFCGDETEPVADLKLEVLDAFCTNPNDRNGLADSYVNGRLGSYKFKTKMVERTQKPKWKEHFKIPIVTWQVPNILALEVCNKGHPTDISLGFVPQLCKPRSLGLFRKNTH